MVNIRRLKDAYIVIHGHFYQPPRENPWLEFVEEEESAHPFHDWNERITLECYRPNGYARVLDEKGRILEIINNYSFINFNFGPTLLTWLEKRFPSVYHKILEGDQESMKRFGHGNAIAQVYHHIILPLANEKDKETEIWWGIADFEKRFQRKPEAIWLPETAVNTETLKVLIKNGMRYLILSPFQAQRVRPLGGRRWTDVSHGRIDTTQPYRWFVKDLSGKKIWEQFIDIFFYNGVMAKEIAFADLLRDGDAFCHRFTQFYQESKGRPQIIHIATDGETYGHHKKFGEMALAYAIEKGFHSVGLEIINYGTFLKRFPPIYEVEIDEGPKGEGSSWSCSHGVARWREDCGCSTGGRPGWNQQWRKPLREALDFLREQLSSIFEREGEEIFQDVWKARNGYIEVILNRSEEKVKTFFHQYGLKGLDDKKRIKGLKLLEMQRHALKMYTSCGWFFADLAGVETLLILQHASRAIQLGEEITGQEIEKKFLQLLSEAKSNLPEMGRGDQIYQHFVKPKWVTPEKVVNHFVLSSLWEDEQQRKRIFSYLVERIYDEKVGEGRDLRRIGQVRVISEVIPEPHEFLFGMIPSPNEIFRTWVSEKQEGLSFDRLKERVFENFEKSEEEIGKIFSSLLGNRILTIRDTLREERKDIFQKLIQKEFDEHCQIYGTLFDQTKQRVEVLSKEGMEIPYEIRIAAEVTLSHRLFEEIKALGRDFKTTQQRGEIDRILQEAKEHHYSLRKEKSLLLLNQILKEKMEALLGDEISVFSYRPEQMEEILALIDSARRWDLRISLEEAQNLLGQRLKKGLEELEKAWWGEGETKPFPTSLLPLAEKLGFNIERFFKIIESTPPGVQDNSIGQP